jgi:hypothetical protein
MLLTEGTLRRHPSAGAVLQKPTLLHLSHARDIFSTHACSLEQLWMLQQHSSEKLPLVNFSRKLVSVHQLRRSTASADLR